jgi:hypothetical protein
MEWQRRHGGLPTSLDQLKEARNPRFVRGPHAEIVDPLTGKMDWILVPPNAAGVNPALQNNPNGGPNNVPTSVWNRPDAQGVTTATSGTPNAPISGGMPGGGAAGSPKDYVGPFIGVRPPVQGQSFVAFNGAENYEQWSFTVQDLMAEINAKNAAMTQWK